MTKRTKTLIALVVSVLVLVVGGPWVYINLIKDDAPDELSLQSTTDTSGAVAPTSTSGSTTTNEVSGA